MPHAGDATGSAGRGSCGCRNGRPGKASPSRETKRALRARCAPMQSLDGVCKVQMARQVPHRKGGLRLYLRIANAFQQEYIRHAQRIHNECMCVITRYKKCGVVQKLLGWLDGGRRRQPRSRR